MNHASRRLNALGRALGIVCYLEVGVSHGTTFFEVEAPSRTGVDPSFQFDWASRVAPGIELMQVPSDDFFQGLPVDRCFDLAYIDGLHTFEQAYRDVCNVLLHSNSRSVILIDDTQPSDVYSSLPDFEACMRHRLASGQQGNAWHGDVFKVVLALHDFHPGLNYRTIVGSGNPQTLVWRSKAGGRVPRLGSFEAISRLTYFDIPDLQPLFRECPEDDAIALCLGELGVTVDC